MAPVWNTMATPLREIFDVTKRKIVINYSFFEFYM
jgi:hypothetical protein